MTIPIKDTTDCKLLNNWRFLIFFFLIIACNNISTPEWENIVTIRLDAEPERLHPVLSRTASAKQIESQLFLPLLQYDPYSLELKPVLAKALPQIDMSKNGTAYTFEIHEDAIWDDRKPITAKDYIFTIKTIFNPHVPTAHYRAYYTFFDHINIDPANSKRFTIYTNTQYILAEAALGTLSIYPAHIYDSEKLLDSVSLTNLISGEVSPEKDRLLKQFAEHFTASSFSQDSRYISGCGPYQLEKWETSQQVILKKKANWWGEKLQTSYPLLNAEPDELIYKIIPDDNAALSLLKAKQLDVLTGIQAETFISLRKDENINANYQFFSPSKLGYYYIGLNGKNEKLNDKNIRRALAYLTDANHIINALLMKMGERLSTPIHPAKPYYNHDLPLIEKDIKRSKSLLEKAGWKDTNQNGILDKNKNGKLTELNLRYAYKAGNQIAENIGILLKNEAVKVGINIQLEAKEFNALIKDYRVRDYEMVFMAWFTSPGLDDLRGTWHRASDTPTGGNRTGFGNADSDAIIDKIRVTFTPKTRRELYLRIQEYIYDEQSYIFLYAPLECMVIHKRFETTPTVISPGFMPNLFRLKEMYSSK